MDVNDLMGSAHRLHNVVYARLEAVANAEKITRFELGHLSREALIYVTDTQDIDFINRLIGVLTPVNKRVAILYFAHFLPWDKEVDTADVFTRFGKKHKGDKAIARKMALIADWLKDEANNIWSWSDANIEIKAKDLAGGLSKAFDKAFDGDEKSNTPALAALEIVTISMNALFSHGVTIDDMMAAIATKEGEIAAALALVQQPDVVAPLAEAA